MLGEVRPAVGDISALGKERKRQRGALVEPSKPKRTKVEESKVDSSVPSSGVAGNPRIEGEGESSFSVPPKDRLGLITPLAE